MDVGWYAEVRADRRRRRRSSLEANVLTVGCNVKRREGEGKRGRDRKREREGKKKRGRERILILLIIIRLRTRRCTEVVAEGKRGVETVPAKEITTKRSVSRIENRDRTLLCFSSEKRHI